MPIASGTAALVAGILGGSGTHVVQVIIGIVVAAALMIFLLSRVVGRGGRGDARAAATAVSDRHRTRDVAMSDATVRLVRTWSGIGIGAQSEQWNIAIDGIVVGSIANKETVEVAVAPGHHTLRLGSDRHRSAERALDVAQDEVAGFTCHGPRLWPVLVAAVINPDLWISLRRE
jgi:hypothetical protein